MASQQTSGGANDSIEGHSYAHDSSFPRPAPPIYFTAFAELAGNARCPSPGEGSLTHSYALQGPSAADAVQPAADNTSAAAQLPSSPNEATATDTAAALPTTAVTTNAPPRQLSAMHQTLLALKLKADAKDPKAAARARAHRIEMRKFRENFDAWVKAEVERLDAEAAAAAARTDNTKTVTADAPPKRLSVMHQTLWNFRLKQDAKDPEAAARARAARIERRKLREEWDAEVKAAEEEMKARKAAGDADADTANAGASQSGTEKRALPAFFYDEHEWTKKWWECHPDRCT
ncbi:hypothetical protein KJ359_011769 [Pestalotiopsis sp. 9143b]|nr:hypothetical protein KJ359_011769 [Pestalotiopsis sp. 9143b]